MLYGLRTAETDVTRDLEVRLEPPRVGVLSLHHFINHGGAEFVVFRATPPDVSPGVKRRRRRLSRRSPAAASASQDPAVRVAFFALRLRPGPQRADRVFARDPAGNEATSSRRAAAVSRSRSPSRASRSTIAFLQRVVPAIAQNTPGAGIDTNDLLQGIPDDQQRPAAAEQPDDRRRWPRKTRPEMMWREAFSQLGNTAVESRFADYRTYFYKGKEIDRQVHLGFDLASLQQAPVAAVESRHRASSPTIWASTATASILDHGLGVQSLYAHLSTMDVKEGETVEKGQVLGRTGVDRAGRRRPSAFHDARQRRGGESGRMVGPALDGRPRVPQDPRSRRPGADAEVAGPADAA